MTNLLLADTTTKQQVATPTKITLVIGMLAALFVGAGLVITIFLKNNSDANSSVIDIYPPAIDILSPVNNSDISGLADVRVSLVDYSGIRTAEIYLDNILLTQTDQPQTNWTYQWDTAKASNGLHSLIIKATDKAGNAAKPQLVAVSVTNK